MLRHASATCICHPQTTYLVDHLLRMISMTRLKLCLGLFLLINLQWCVETLMLGLQPSLLSWLVVISSPVYLLTQFVAPEVDGFSPCVKLLTCLYIMVFRSSHLSLHVLGRMEPQLLTIFVGDLCPVHSMCVRTLWVLLQIIVL